jgi:hypothetical protein
MGTLEVTDGSNILRIHPSNDHFNSDHLINSLINKKSYGDPRINGDINL